MVDVCFAPSLYARNLDEDDRCRSVIQPLARFFADAMLRLAATCADELHLRGMKLDALSG
jgi:hypothetical protein